MIDVRTLRSLEVPTTSAKRHSEEAWFVSYDNDVATLTYGREILLRLSLREKRTIKTCMGHCRVGSAARKAKATSDGEVRLRLQLHFPTDLFRLSCNIIISLALTMRVIASEVSPLGGAH